MKQELAEAVVIPLEKKRWNIKQIEKIIIKMEPFKISELLDDSTVSKLSKFVTKNGLR